MVAGLEKPAMPLDGKLTAAQVESIKLWIDQGAEWERCERSGGGQRTGVVERRCSGAGRGPQLLGVS